MRQSATVEQRGLDRKQTTSIEEPQLEHWFNETERSRRTSIHDNALKLLRQESRKRRIESDWLLDMGNMAGACDFGESAIAEILHGRAPEFGPMA